ncbi:MAG: hypothetical protein LBE32_00820 [Burkholderiales bacterium]|jgi:hypothetical protein|nr:hypothetical protein [Burkholderiales bacterium]
MASAIFNDLCFRKATWFASKRFFLALVWTLLFLPGLSWAQGWASVGTSPRFSESGAFYLSHALDTSKTPPVPYVAYSDEAHGKRLSVMKFNGSSWEYVGDPGFSVSVGASPSPVEVTGTSLTIASDGTPYVAYQDGTDSSRRGAVVRFVGTSWQRVGEYFSENIALSISLALDAAGTPYVAYRDFANDDKASVRRFNGSNWEYVGNSGFSEIHPDYISLKLDTRTTPITPYVAYEDGDWDGGYGATLMKLVGNAWVRQGDASFTGQASYVSLALDMSTNPSTVYVAFRKDDSGEHKVSVKRLNGSNWGDVGTPGFSSGEARHVSLAANASMLYVAYQDMSESGGGKTSVMKFEGGAWNHLGSQGFSTGESHDVSLSLSASGAPYVAYMDWSNGGKAAVMRFLDNIVTLSSTGVVFDPVVAGGTLPTLEVTCTPSATVVTVGSSWSAPEGASCQLSVSGGSPPSGYTMGTATYSGTGVNAAGAFTVPAGGISDLSATVALTPNIVTLSSTGVVFDPVVAGGTLPTLEVTCTPGATVVTVGSSWSAPEGASCQLSVSGGSPPSGYTMGTATYSGTGVNAAGEFTVPAGGISDLSATVALVSPPISFVEVATAARNLVVAFNPPMPGGTPPTLTLSCTPSATFAGVGVWQVQVGATCQLGRTGGTPPAGYSFGAMTYSGSGVNGTTGVFTPLGNINNLGGTITLVPYSGSTTTIPTLGGKALMVLALLALLLGGCGLRRNGAK